MVKGSVEIDAFCASIPEESLHALYGREEEKKQAIVDDLLQMMVREREEDLLIEYWFIGS